MIEDEDDPEVMLEKNEKEYIEFSDKLLAAVHKREDLLKLLKIAHPNKILQINQAVSALDSLIERLEKRLEIIDRLITANKELIREYAVLEKMTDIIEADLTQYIKENCPEKLELLEAILSDDGKSH